MTDTLPIVGEFKDRRQLSGDHWQGVDVDGTMIDVRGGLMPPYLIVETGQYRPFRNAWGWTTLGLIRLV
jgi:hypothetical protein